jgi:hypothetical protein
MMKWKSEIKYFEEWYRIRLSFWYMTYHLSLYLIVICLTTDEKVQFSQTTVVFKKQKQEKKHSCLHFWMFLERCKISILLQNKHFIFTVDTSTISHPHRISFLSMITLSWENRHFKSMFFLIGLVWYVYCTALCTDCTRSQSSAEERTMRIGWNLHSERSEECSIENNFYIWNKNSLNNRKIVSKSWSIVKIYH